MLLFKIKPTLIELYRVETLYLSTAITLTDFQEIVECDVVDK